jgi:hypothetical protein
MLVPNNSVQTHRLQYRTAATTRIQHDTVRCSSVPYPLSDWTVSPHLHCHRSHLHLHYVVYVVPDVVVAVQFRA